MLTKSPTNEYLSDATWLSQPQEGTSNGLSPRSGTDTRSRSTIASNGLLVLIGALLIAATVWVSSTGWGTPKQPTTDLVPTCKSLSISQLAALDGPCLVLPTPGVSAQYKLDHTDWNRPALLMPNGDRFVLSN